MRRLLLFVLLAMGPLVNGLAPAADLTVRVDAREVMRNHLHTDMTLAVHGGPLTLVFPQWLPGEHGPTGPLDTLIGLTVRANGTTLSWQRDPFDMFAIRLTVPAGATQLDIALDSGLRVEGGDFSSGPTSTDELAVLAWNQVVLLPKGRDAATLTTLASVRAPPQWQLNCALTLTPQGEGGVQLEAASLERLIDSPLQMGRYGRRIELAGAAPLPQLKHTLAIVADSPAAYAVPDDFAHGYEQLVAQAGALFGSRMYRHYTWLVTLSDHVSSFGLEHHESSDDRVAANELSEAPLRERVAELLAHEYVHSWNGKYRRPAGLLSPDYQKPMDGSLLWVYEGLTQFWGEVLPVRAGITPPADYREMLANFAGTFEVESGARWRPLADTAVAAQILYDAPHAWQSSRRDVDFYEASEFLWLNVDAELRARSGGHASLDDFMQRFYAGASGAPALKPYVEADVYSALAALAAGDWRALVRAHLDSLGPQQLLAGLEASGWRLTYSQQPNSFVVTYGRRKKLTDRRWSVGLVVDDKDTVVDVIENRAAARAGLGPGMRLVAVNGHRFSPEVLDAALAAAHDSHQAIELLIEHDDVFRTLHVEYFDGVRFPHLIRIDDRPDTLTQVLAARGG